MITDRTKVAELVQIPNGISERDFDRYLREAEEFDLRELMNDAFYHELKEKPADDKYKILIQGDEYEYEGKNYTFSGIDKALSYFTYGRMMMFANVVLTSHGVVVKKTPDSEPLVIEERKNFYYAQRENANNVFDQVRLYIERHIEDYPLWNLDSCETVNNTFNTYVIQ